MVGSCGGADKNASRPGLVVGEPPGAIFFSRAMMGIAAHRDKMLDMPQFNMGTDMAQRKPPSLLSGEISLVISQTTYRNFGGFSPTEAWSPAVNVYRLGHLLEICVDLAGVHRQQVQVQVEPGRLLIRGIRHAPDPPERGDEPMRIVSMEIDYGPFCRAIAIPDDVQIRQVESEYRDGMLWVRLPIEAR
jgi:HSP20 family protein